MRCPYASLMSKSFCFCLSPSSLGRHRFSGWSKCYSLYGLCQVSHRHSRWATFPPTNLHHDRPRLDQDAAAESFWIQTCPIGTTGEAEGRWQAMTIYTASNWQTPHAACSSSRCRRHRHFDDCRCRTQLFQPLIHPTPGRFFFERSPLLWELFQTWYFLTILVVL